MTIQQAYKAILSTKHEVKIDPNEIDAVMSGIEHGQMIRVRQGLINPSYLVTIVEDTDRQERFLNDTKYSAEKRIGGMKQLKDIFEHSHLRIDGPSARGPSMKLGAGEGS